MRNSDGVGYEQDIFHGIFWLHIRGQGGRVRVGAVVVGGPSLLVNWEANRSCLQLKRSPGADQGGRRGQWPKGSCSSSCKSV